MCDFEERSFLLHLHRRISFSEQKSSEIAITTVEDWAAAHLGTMERVIFNVFKDEDKGYYEALLS